MNVFKKVNWKAVAIVAGIVSVLNISNDEKYPAAYALGTGIGFTLVTLPISLVTIKGEKDYVTE